VGELAVPFLGRTDEEGTHERLKAHLAELVSPKIKEHKGRTVKNTGDGFLAEFASVVDAVRCAVEVQREMVEQNAAIPPEKRIEFRVGINLGDVIAEGEDIFGDGVNVAAPGDGRTAAARHHTGIGRRSRAADITARRRLRSSFVGVTPVSPIWSGRGVFEAAERRFRHDGSQRRDPNLCKVVEISLAASQDRGRCDARPKTQVRMRLSAGGRWIRTLGPRVMEVDLGRQVPALIAVFELAGTAVTSQRGIKCQRRTV
jgi:hypothetical protein